ncbi:MAG: NADH-quinone oxidoreductase subunit K [candidate division WS1 bacterium]|jgi:multicomponent Na+:H+ antiporter subunit C|nr:NADH-quinone oxidoreductase subunit K [candidate division WS1 bacterium]
MTPYAAAGFALVLIGMYATITRTNLLQIIIGLEIMARGVSLVFVLGGFQTGTMAAAQSVVVTVILIEAVTVAIALSLVVASYHHNKSLSIAALRRLKG